MRGRIDDPGTIPSGLDISGTTADHAGRRWRLDAAPELHIRMPVREIRTPSRDGHPNIWSEGGSRYGVTLSFDLFIPDGATPPSFDDLLRRIGAALRE